MAWKDKPPGLKILWIWAFGTAGIMVTSVMRSRMQEMEKMMKVAEEQQNALQEGSGEVDSSSSSSEVILDDKMAGGTDKISRAVRCLIDI
ncbi:hypothetical protein V2J09_023645 [Rumex salicifolius]